MLFKLPSFICKCFYVRVNVWLDDVIACVENVILLSSSEHINKWRLSIRYFTWLLERVWCVMSIRTSMFMTNSFMQSSHLDCWLYSHWWIYVNICFKSLITGFRLSGSIRLMVMFSPLSEVDLTQPTQQKFPLSLTWGIQASSSCHHRRNQETWFCPFLKQSSSDRILCPGSSWCRQFWKYRCQGHS